jgi:succinoglycan biosynthesis protein ExoO
LTSFAVVIPLHNKGPHIDRALAAVLAQRHPAHEIIVVDDASSDDGLKRVLACKGENLRIIRRPTPGPGGYAARNLAIMETKAEWVAFLDADDEWLPDHLSELHKVISTAGDDAVCAFAGYVNAHADGRHERDRFSRQTGREQVRGYNFDAFLSAWLATGECPIWTSASAFRRQTLIDSGLFPAGRCARGGDKDLWLRVARNGQCIAIPAVTAIYHRDSVNMVTRSSKTTGRHCLCDTIVAMLETVPVASRPLLRRLFNQEVYQYALAAVKGGNIRPEAWRGFYLRDDPLRFAILAGLSTVPGAYAARQLHRLRGAR